MSRIETGDEVSTLVATDSVINGFTYLPLTVSASIARRRGRRDVGDRQGDDKAWVVIWECLKMRMAHIKIFAGGSDQKGQPPGRARSEKSR